MKTSGLTVLGTDTDVGKTYVSCRILESLVQRGIKVGAYKPVASGAPTREQSDGYQLWLASGQRRSLDEVNPQRFLAPLAPPIAAELEGKQLSDSMILDGANHWRKHCDFLLVEGAGGLLSPISWAMTNASLALELKFPIVLVSENRLGVVNQVLTTLVAARSHGLSVRCVVLNEAVANCDDSTNSNLRMLEVFLHREPNPPRVLVLRHNTKTFETETPRWEDF